MRKNIGKREFNSLDDDALSAVCAETMIEAYKEVGRRAGDFQSEMFSRLTQGQQALFMFRIYYNHVIKSADDYHWWNAYFLPQKNLWFGIKSAFHFFADEPGAQLLQEVEDQLRKYFFPKLMKDVTSTDIYPDTALQEMFTQAFRNFRQTAPATLKTVASHIRSHSEQFADLK